MGQRRMRWIAGLGIMGVIAGCAGELKTTTVVYEAGKSTVSNVAASRRQWTGMAISPGGRLFVNYPRWSDQVPVSVAEVSGEGTARPYPNSEINRWEAGADPATHFVCVQSVVMDPDGQSLWILDPASPKIQGVVAGGAKLVQVDLATNHVVRTIAFDTTIATPRSYLNDIRFDRQGFGYLTDSGAGGLVVLELRTGMTQRVLQEHPSTHSEHVPITIDGKTWHRPDGSIGEGQSDGIAYDPEGDWIYYHALTGRTLYRIAAKALRDAAYGRLGGAELAAQVQKVAETGVCDGMEYGGQGAIYLSGLEPHAIQRWSPARGLETLVQDPRLQWPDSFAIGPDSRLYVTTSQIHLMPEPAAPFGIWMVREGRAR